MGKCLLIDVKFWYPPFQMGIPFDSYGFRNFRGGECIGNDEYIFATNKELDAFLLPNGELLPIDCATLCDAQGVVIPFDSFSIDRGKDCIQINKRTRDSNGYHCKVAKCSEIYIQGDSYDPFDE